MYVLCEWSNYANTIFKYLSGFVFNQLFYIDGGYNDETVLYSDIHFLVRHIEFPHMKILFTNVLFSSSSRIEMFYVECK